MNQYQAELYHHGIKGQKWGVRHFQNSDGSLTKAGRERYDSLSDSQRKKYDRFEKKINRKIEKSLSSDQRYADDRQKALDRRNAKYDQKIDRLQKDIQSFDQIKNGLKDNKGREILSKKDVKESVDSLKKRISRIEQKRKTTIENYKSYDKYVSKGEKMYNDTLKKYRNAKLSSFLESGVKKDQEYKNAIRKYTAQALIDANNYGLNRVSKSQYSNYLNAGPKQIYKNKRR